MIRDSLKVSVIGSITALVLSGCVGDFGWPIATDEQCGQIDLVSSNGSSLENPRLFLDTSGDVGRLNTSVEWTVLNAPEGYYVNPEVSGDVERIFGYGIPSLPFGWIANQGAETPEELLFLEGKFIYGFQGPAPEPLSINESGNLIYSNSLAQEEVLPLDLLFDEAFAGGNYTLLPLFYSLIHLPTNLIASCGQTIEYEDFYDDVSGDVGRTVNQMQMSSSLEIYPGFVPNLIDFESDPSRVSFRSAIVDGRVPIAASVVPWFSGYSDFPELNGGTPLNFDGLTAFEQFWIGQLFLLEGGNNADPERLMNVYAFLNPALTDNEGYPNPYDSDEIVVNLDNPLNEATYKNLFDEEIQSTLGELEYLFVYTVFIQEIDDGTGRQEISYSFERYYPGVSGDIVDAQQYAIEQQPARSFAYSGPIITSFSERELAEKTTTKVTISGERLSSITKLQIGSQDISFTLRADGKIDANIPPLTKGLYDLRVIYNESSLMTHQAAIEVIAQKPQRFGKVNAGAVKGKVVIYAADLQGSKISWKIGGNWGSAVANSNFTRFERTAVKRGQSFRVEIYVNGKKTLTKEIVVR